MDWTSQLPDKLRKAAYHASNEFAWTKSDSLDVIDWLSSQGLSVSGVELWLATHPGPTIPTPYVYQWSARPATVGQSNAAVQNTAAKKYISEFEWDEKDHHRQGQTPYFNLTV
jgi:hypothetical protein